MARHEIAQRAQFHVDVPDSLPPVAGSGSRISQVFLNLLVNAAQAITPGRADANSITLRASVRGNEVVAEVVDTGAGVAPDVMKRIFDPFFTTKPVGVGTGLGLAICHGILRDMGATMEVESTLGVGSTFRVSMPIAPPARREVQPPASTAPLPRRKVLLVDDEPMVLKALQRQLSSFHDITATSQAREAINLIAHGGFDAIVIDVLMPGMSGVDVQRALLSSKSCACSRTIFVTGGAASDEIGTFLNDYPGRVLGKPVEVARLRETIERVVASSNAAAANTPGARN